MPCYDAQSEFETIDREWKARLDAATAAACEMYRCLVAADINGRLSVKTLRWAQKHAKADAAR